MVTELSIVNDNNQNNTMNETADQDETMMDVDGQADNTGLNKTLDHSVGEENDPNVIIQKRREYYLRAKNTADAIDAGDIIDTVIIFDALETAETANTDETLNTAEQNRVFMSLSSREVDDYLESEDFKPILRITQEQLLIDWLTSRHLLNKNDSDE